MSGGGSKISSIKDIYVETLAFMWFCDALPVADGVAGLCESRKDRSERRELGQE
jgi:hypothetical protein